MKIKAQDHTQTHAMSYVQMHDHNRGAGKNSAVVEETFTQFEMMTIIIQEEKSL